MNTCVFFIILIINSKFLHIRDWTIGLSIAECVFCEAETTLLYTVLFRLNLVPVYSRIPVALRTEVWVYGRWFAGIYSFCSVEQSPSWETDRFSASEEIPHI